MGSHRINSNHRIAKLTGAAFAAGALLLVGPAAAAFADPVSDAGGQVGAFGGALDKQLGSFGGALDKQTGAFGGALVNQTGGFTNALGQQVNGSVIKGTNDGNQSTNILVNNLNGNLRSILGFQSNGGTSK